MGGNKPHRVSPVFKRQLETSKDVLLAALKDGVSGAAFRSWQREPTQSWLETFLSLVKRDHPEAWRLLGVSGFRNLAYSAIGAPVGPLRMKTVPGLVEERPLWVLINEADADGLRREIQPGQIWINATNLAPDHYRDLWGIISYQQQRLGQAINTGGRPSLTDDECRKAAKLKGEGWTHAEIGEYFDWPLQPDAYGKPRRCRTSEEAVRRGKLLRT